MVIILSPIIETWFMRYGHDIDTTKKDKNEELKLKLIHDGICVDPLTPINKRKLVCDATFPQPLEQITC
jgi:hypothetical protein